MQQYKNENQHDGNTSFLLLYNNTIQTQQPETASIHQLTVLVGQESGDDSAELSASEFQSCNPDVRPKKKKKCGLISKLTGERVTCKLTQVAGRPNAFIVIQPGTQFLSSHRLAVAFYS